MIKEEAIRNQPQRNSIVYVTMLSGLQGCDPGGSNRGNAGRKCHPTLWTITLQAGRNRTHSVKRTFIFPETITVKCSLARTKLNDCPSNL